MREVGYVYLVATRLGTLCLFAMFALCQRCAATGTWSGAASTRGAPLGDAVFVLALVGFGLKAGIMPLHVWLPGAHANAPSHVSALMSGVLIKIGHLRARAASSSLFPPPAAVVGRRSCSASAVVSGVLGVAFAIGQHDLKRLLAYHSVENIGIICMGLGAGAARARRSGGRELVVLGLGGALLHVWNHAPVQGAAVPQRRLGRARDRHARDRPPGRASRKPMPWTALAFLVGAVAICGLPPLNGFVSELLIYLGLFRACTRRAGTLWLAARLRRRPRWRSSARWRVACFVKVFGAVFLGQPRSERDAARAHEAARQMLVPMGVARPAAACCIGLGAARWSRRVLDARALAWAPELAARRRSSALAPLRPVAIVALLLAR